MKPAESRHIGINEWWMKRNKDEWMNDEWIEIKKEWID